MYRVSCDTRASADGSNLMRGSQSASTAQGGAQHIFEESQCSKQVHALLEHVLGVSQPGLPMKDIGRHAYVPWISDALFKHNSNGFGSFKSWPRPSTSSSTVPQSATLRIIHSCHTLWFGSVRVTKAGMATHAWLAAENTYVL